MKRFIPPAYDSFILTMILCALCVGEAPVFADPDTAWHLAAGDLIRSLHGIPLQDTWSFTATDERWYNLSWLFDIAFSSLFAAGGFGALYALTVLVFALSLTYMAHQCVRRGAALVTIFPLALFAMLVMYVGVLARPNMCSVVLTIVFYQLLHRFRTSGRWQDLLPLPPLMALWVNVHGGFLLVFVIMGIFCAEAYKEHDRARLTGYEVLIAACLAATLVNPYGFGVYYGAYKSVAGAFDNQSILEWKPVEIGRHLPMTAWLILMLSVGDMSDKRIPWSDRILANVALVLSLASVRHSILGVMLMLPYASLRLTHALQESALRHSVAEADKRLTLDMQDPATSFQAFTMALGAAAVLVTTYPRVYMIFVPLVTLILSSSLCGTKLGQRFCGVVAVKTRMSLRTLLLYCALVGMLVLALPLILTMKEPSGFPVKMYPEKEAAYVEEHYPHLRLLTDYDMGGYLDYLWRGRVKVFVDGRASSLYSDDLLEDYTDFINSQGYGMPAQVILQHYKIDGLMFLNTNKLIPYLFSNPDWRVAYRGDVATVFLKNDAPAKKKH